MSLFWGARSKVDRAEEHVNDLNGMLTDFVSAETHVVFVERDLKTGQNLLKVRPIKSLPPKFSFILGDAVHNLRTSLDYAINEIELLYTGQMTSHTKFPVRENSQGFEAAINGGLKEKIPARVLECIKYVVQPYAGGDGDAIWQLHELDIRDKHQILITKTELTDVEGIRIEDDRGVEHVLDNWRVINHHIVGYPVTGTENVKITNQGHGTFRVTFSQGLPLGGSEIIPTLCNLAEFVKRVLNELEHAFRLSHI